MEVKGVKKEACECGDEAVERGLAKLWLWLLLLLLLWGLGR